MRYEDLSSRYGTHVSQRVRRELTASEFDSIAIDALPEWLEARAESAHENYLRLLGNPLAIPDIKGCGTKEACRRWREAEDLAYLIVVAEDVGSAAHAN